MDKQLPEAIDMDKSLNELCKNSIDLMNMPEELQENKLTLFS